MPCLQTAGKNEKDDIVGLACVLFRDNCGYDPDVDGDLVRAYPVSVVEQETRQCEGSSRRRFRGCGLRPRRVRKKGSQE